MPDIFDDLDAIRRSASEDAGIAVIEVATHHAVRKPRRTEFVKTNPAPEMRIPAHIFIDPEDREGVYFVSPTMLGTMLGEAQRALLLPTISTQGVMFVWPVRLPQDDGRRNDWHATALQAAELSRERWVRVTPDMQLRAYRIFHPEGDIAEPEWPDRSLPEILRLAFRDRVIDREDHAIIRRLRGRA